jgi:ribosomal protein S7
MVDKQESLSALYQRLSTMATTATPEELALIASAIAKISGDVTLERISQAGQGAQEAITDQQRAALAAITAFAQQQREQASIALSVAHQILQPYVI